jgi:hypothetical protein
MRLFCLIALAVAVALATAASPFASASPDGLEKVAEQQGFADRGRLAAVQEHAPVPDYALPGASDPRIATGAAGLAGSLLVFGSAVVLVRIARRTREAA